eukprot:jgi/Hompol1/6340/HPOL_000879-RA
MSEQEHKQSLNDEKQQHQLQESQQPVQEQSETRNVANEPSQRQPTPETTSVTGVEKRFEQISLQSGDTDTSAQRTVLVCLDNSDNSQYALDWTMRNIVSPTTDIVHVMTALHPQDYLHQFTRETEGDSV